MVSPRLFPLLAALTEVFGMTGAALGQETLGFIVERAGWRVGMISCGVFSAVLLLLIVLFVRLGRSRPGALMNIDLDQLRSRGC